MIKRIVLITILGHVMGSGFAQIPLLAPYGDTLFFDSKRFELKTGKQVFLFEGKTTNYEENIIQICTYRLKIERLVPRVLSEATRREELFRPYRFDRYIEVDTISCNCDSYDLEVDENMSFLFAFQSKYRPTAVLLASPTMCISHNDTIFDFAKKEMIVADQPREIQTIRGVSWGIGKEHVLSLLEVIVTYPKEGHSQGYFICIRDEKIQAIYCWMEG